MSSCLFPRKIFANSSSQNEDLRWPVKMSYLPVCDQSWLHIVKQRKKPARSWWKIIGKRIEDIPRDKLKISLLQTLYIFGRILLVLFRTKKCALRELFGDLLYILFILLLAIESTKKTEYGLVEKQNTHNSHKLSCCGNLNYAGNRLTAPEYNSRLHCFCIW